MRFITLTKKFFYKKVTFYITFICNSEAVIEFMSEGEGCAGNGAPLIFYDILRAPLLIIFCSI